MALGWWERKGFPCATATTSPEWWCSKTERSSTNGNGCDAHTAVHVFSVTKSVVALLFGIAFDKGCLESVDQRVLEFFPAYPVKRGEKTLPHITIEDLLTMTVPYKYRSAPYTKYFSSENWVYAALDLMGGKGRVGEFRYAPLIGPDVLTGILAQATGRSALEPHFDAAPQPERLPTP